MLNYCLIDWLLLLLLLLRICSWLQLFMQYFAYYLSVSIFVFRFTVSLHLITNTCVFSHDDRRRVVPDSPYWHGMAEKGKTPKSRLPSVGAAVRRKWLCEIDISPIISISQFEYISILVSDTAGTLWGRYEFRWIWTNVIVVCIIGQFTI